MDSVRVLLFLTCGVLLLWVGETLAQTGGGGFGVPAPPPGAEGTVPELEAWQAILEERYIAGRELAEAVLRESPDSIVAHITAGVAQKYGEGNFPRARYHLEQARSSIESEWGQEPPPEGPWLWHLRTLRILSAVYGDLELYTNQLTILARYNEIYDPDLLAERAWPLMKLREFERARQAATDGIESGDPRQVSIGLNAHCAIEFEAGLDGVSYEACRRALDYARSRGDVSTVDLTNFSEAARSLFRFDEAESTLLEATRSRVSWYGNPWVDLADLYVRQGRFAEAGDALQRSMPYRERRPPHVQNSDRSEGRRSVAAFRLAVGSPEGALRTAESATRLRDRRGHNSRDPEQDWAVASLVERRARILAAESTVERAVANTWFRRSYAWIEASVQRLVAWMRGRTSAKLLGQRGRLVGLFQVGTSNSSTLPPWLIGDAVEVVGAGVALEAIRNARERDMRPGADGYYDAFAAEALWRQGKDVDALARVRSALEELPETEALLRARVLAIQADANWKMGSRAEAIDQYSRAFQFDPGVFRRLELRLPVSLQSVGSGDVLEDSVDAIENSPRFEVHAGSPFVVRVEQADKLRVCLLAPDDSILACAEQEVSRDEGAGSIVERLMVAFHEVAFMPRIDMSQSDVEGLDGSNQVGPNPLGDFLDLDDGP